MFLRNLCIYAALNEAVRTGICLGRRFMNFRYRKEGHHVGLWEVALR